MLVENFMILCDHAFFSDNKKMNVIGIFENITPPEGVPYMHPSFFVVSKVRTAAGNRRFAVRIRKKDADANEPDVKRSPDLSIDVPADKKGASLVVQLNLTEFRTYGEYLIEVLVDDAPALHTILHVKQR